jgi:MFS family permease
VFFINSSSKIATTWFGDKEVILTIIKDINVI